VGWEISVLIASKCLVHEEKCAKYTESSYSFENQKPLGLQKSFSLALIRLATAPELFLLILGERSQNEFLEISVRSCWLIR
jgi:hypothetical protein